MILNAFSIIEVFISAVSLILMMWCGLYSLVLALRWRRTAGIENRSLIEDRSHLVLLVGVTILGIRLVNWPFFYATLQSFIQEIDGAMCIFGVTQLKRISTGISEILKPLTFFLIGGWLLLHLLDQKSRTSALMDRKIFFLSVTAAFVVLESALDVFLMLNIAPGTLVSCCTTVTDILERPTRLVPESVLGQGYAGMLEFGYYFSNFLLMALLGGGLWLLRSFHRIRWRRATLGFLFLFALGNAVLFILTQIEVHAPEIMGLPFHHCLYCLWQYVPDTILMYFLFVLGTSAVGWGFLLDLLGRSDETMEALSRYLNMLMGFSLFCYAASLVMNTVHIVAA